MIPVYACVVGLLEVEEQRSIAEELRGQMSCIDSGGPHICTAPQKLDYTLWLSVKLYVCQARMSKGTPSTSLKGVSWSTPRWSYQKLLLHTVAL